MFKYFCVLCLLISIGKPSIAYSREQGDKVLYQEFLGKRLYTTKKAIDVLKATDKYNRTLIVVELGTSRSFRSGYIESNPKMFNPLKPKTWDWGAGLFTKVIVDNLVDNDYLLYSIDPDDNALAVAKHLVGSDRHTRIKKDFSTNFLKNFQGKIDLLYMDHAESSESACQLHLEDAKLIVERGLIADSGMILVDDANYPSYKNSKGKYSIPYLLNSGFEIISSGYQVLLQKSHSKAT